MKSKAYRKAVRKSQMKNPKSNERHCNSCGQNYMKQNYHRCS